MRSQISALISNRSLRSRLIIILSLISLLVWFIATGAEWYKFRKEMNKQFDTQLILFAERLASSNIVEGYHEVMSKKEKIAKREVNDDALGFAIFSEKGEPLFSDGRDGKYIEFRAQEGFHQSLFTEEDGDVDLWRVFWLKHHDIYIAVGHEMEYREELIFDVMLSKFWGGIIALPLMMFAIWFIVTRELATLKRLAQEVKQRKPDDTLAIEASQLPAEIRPLVESLNHYFERTNTMFSRERRFTSDAAHELLALFAENGKS